VRQSAGAKCLSESVVISGWVHGKQLILIKNTSNVENLLGDCQLSIYLPCKDKWNTFIYFF